MGKFNAHKTACIVSHVTSWLSCARGKMGSAAFTPLP